MALPPKPRRPILIDSLAVEQITSPAPSQEIAHETAQAILDHGRHATDPATIDRLVRLAETEGIDQLAALWANATAHTLPGALWRLYALREWSHAHPDTLTLRYRLGLVRTPVHAVIAGATHHPSRRDVQRILDQAIAGIYTGDVAVSLERAASWCRVIATGGAIDADVREVVDSDAAHALTRTAASLVRTAEELEHCAHLWRCHLLE